MVIKYLISRFELMIIKNNIKKKRTHPDYKGVVSFKYSPFSEGTQKYLKYLHNLFLIDSTLTDEYISFKGYPTNLDFFKHISIDFYKKAQSSPLSSMIEIDDIAIASGDSPQNKTTENVNNILNIDFVTKKKK